MPYAVWHCGICGRAAKSRADAVACEAKGRRALPPVGTIIVAATEFGGSGKFLYVVADPGGRGRQGHYPTDAAAWIWRDMQVPRASEAGGMVWVRLHDSSPGVATCPVKADCTFFRGLEASGVRGVDCSLPLYSRMWRDLHAAGIVPKVVIAGGQVVDAEPPVEMAEAEAVGR